MDSSKRKSLTILALPLLSYNEIVSSCSISWIHAIPIEYPLTPKPSISALSAFLDKRFGIGEWVEDIEQTISLKHPKRIEDVLKLQIQYDARDTSYTCSEFIVFVERKAGYAGNKWSHMVREERLTFRYEASQFLFPKTKNTSISCRLKRPGHECRIIVAAKTLSKEGLSKWVVRTSLPIPDAQAHCGGKFYVDTVSDAEKSSCSGYPDDSCPLGY